jgi:hypothetical protein
MSVVEERRCPNCGALVSEDADWCGQCFASLRPEPEPEPQAAPAAVRPAGPVLADGERRDPTWACPTCEHPNPIDLDVCAVCGTPFAALFRENEARPAVEPRAALTRSLIFPGLGHRMLGRGADGVARGMLFLWTFGTTLLILVSDVSAGPVVSLLALYGLLAVAVYVLTAFEAYRIAQGGAPIVSSRVLLWGAVSLVLVSVLMATFIIFTAARS